VRVLAVEPWHPACAHAQSMSGVCSIASHCGLQYLLLLADEIVQLQTGCAHFSALSVAIVFLPARIDNERDSNGDPRANVLPMKIHFQYWTRFGHCGIGNSM